jgi:hypothetical protein
MMSMEQNIQKEKSHVVDYHRNSGNSVATRLFRPEHKSEFPANRQLDTHSARSCRHPLRFKSVGDHLDQRSAENRRGGPVGRLSIFNTRKEISNGIHYYHRTDRTVHYWLLAIKPIHYSSHI